MNEQAIKELYQEFYFRFEKMKKQVQAAPNSQVEKKLSDMLNELKSFLDTLKEKAAKNGIELNAADRVQFKNDASNDWVQLIDVATMSDTIKTALRGQINTLGETPPNTKQAMNLVEQIDKYYEANINTPNNTKIIEAFEKAFGRKPNEELSNIIEAYRKSANDAILEAIKGINTTYQLSAKKDFHPIFERNFLQNGANAAADEERSNLRNRETQQLEEGVGVPIPNHQYKLDIAEKEWGAAQEAGIFKFTAPKVQVSFIISYTKTAHVARMSDEAIFSEHVDSFLQLGRSTLSINNIYNALKREGKGALGSSNFLSKGHVIPTPLGNIIIKSEVASVNWGKINQAADGGKKLSIAELSLGAFRLQYEGNILNNFPSIANIGITKVVFKISGGFNVSLTDKAYQAVVERLIRTKAEKAAAKAAAKDLAEKKLREKLNKEMLEEMLKQADDLEKDAKTIKTILQDAKNKAGENIANRKKQLGQFLDDFGDLIKKAEDTVWNNTAFKQSAEEIAEKASKKIVQIVGKELIEVLAKTTLKLVPGIAFASALYDCFSLIYSGYDFLYKKGWFSSNLNWEDAIEILLSGGKLN